MKRIIVLIVSLVILSTLHTSHSTLNAISYSIPVTEVGAGVGDDYNSGYQSADDYYGCNTGYRAGGPNRLGPADGNTEEEENDPSEWDPNHENDPLPIGNGVWILFALAVAYGAWKRERRKGGKAERRKGGKADRRKGGGEFIVHSA